ncbi:MAG: YcgN family cysteine cluster protein [Methylococcaceae bacterium]|nr:YcgN family cysteine cluster protein [Methylococcaceae bacterium]
MKSAPFWKSKKLTEMNRDEWESLCDGCGKCCLNKLEDEDTGEIVFTSVVCDLIDLKTCRCTDYENRTRLVPDCIDIKSEQFVQYDWLPSTCAYRLIAEGRDLPSWHPLISGRPESVHEAGVSIRSYAITESESSDLMEHIIEWLD